MSEVQNTKDVYKIYNNSHYQLLDKKDNFSLLVNKALGKKATSPSTLHSCDSREISLILEATEKAIEEKNKTDSCYSKNCCSLKKLDFFYFLSKNQVIFRYLRVLIIGGVNVRSPKYQRRI